MLHNVSAADCSYQQHGVVNVQIDQLRAVVHVLIQVLEGRERRVTQPQLHGYEGEGKGKGEGGGEG